MTRQTNKAGKIILAASQKIVITKIKLTQKSEFFRYSINTDQKTVPPTLQISPTQHKFSNFAQKTMNQLKSN
jgi:hypothetical protein